MKKIVLTLAVVFSMSFCACSNKENAAESSEACCTECAEGCTCTDCANTCGGCKEACEGCTETTEVAGEEVATPEGTTEVVEGETTTETPAAE